MEVRIKNNGELVDATIEMVDGVMVVSPKEVKVDVSQFKDGDVITCGWDCNNESYNWTGILCGEIECISDNMFIGDYCSLDCKGDFLDHNSSSDSATWVRYATEEEKQKLFNKLKEEGLEWNADTKELVKLKWKPRVGERFYYPANNDHSFKTYHHEHSTQEFLELDKDIKIGWCFKTKEECQAFCDRLNDAIKSVKP